MHKPTPPVSLRYLEPVSVAWMHGPPVEGLSVADAQRQISERGDGCEVTTPDGTRLVVVPFDVRRGLDLLAALRHAVWVRCSPQILSMGHGRKIERVDREAWLGWWTELVAEDVAPEDATQLVVLHMRSGAEVPSDADQPKSRPRDGR